MVKFFFRIVAAGAMTLFLQGCTGASVSFVSDWPMVLEFFINAFVVGFLIGIYNAVCFKLGLAFQLGIPFLAGFIFHALYRYFYSGSELLLQILSIIFGFAFFHLIKALYRHLFLKS